MQTIGGSPPKPPRQEKVAAGGDGYGDEKKAQVRTAVQQERVMMFVYVRPASQSEAACW
jgi:hypothetical protein